MTYGDLQTDLQNMSIVTSQPVLIQHALQWALNIVSQSFEFPYYMNSKGVINCIATYSTGTITTVNGSTTVIGVGTNWTSAMVGRKIQVMGDTAWYYITAVNSTTNLTISNIYQGTGGSTQTYNIYKDEYKLAPDVQSYNTIVQIQNSVPMLGIPPSRFDQFFPTQQSFDSPYLEMMEGSQLDIYTTGTLSTVINTSTITGAGTSWLSVEGLGRMTNLTIAGNRYTVKSVNSDTSITIYETALSTISASSYSLLLNNYKTQVFPIPSSNQALYYRYYRMPDIMFNTYDTPDLPNDWHWLLLWGGAVWLYLQKGDLQKSFQEAKMNFNDGIKMMRVKMGNPSADRIYRRISQDGRLRPLDGLEKGTFDRRWSSP